jgi:hypothetical protein
VQVTGWLISSKVNYSWTDMLQSKYLSESIYRDIPQGIKGKEHIQNDLLLGE